MLRIILATKPNYVKKTVLYGQASISMLPPTLTIDPHIRADNRTAY